MPLRLIKLFAHQAARQSRRREGYSCACQRPAAQKAELELHLAAAQRVLFGDVPLKVGTRLEHRVAPHAGFCHGL